jgi:hypothetical protein
MSKMVHIFVVDENTLKYHLEYMFAGTGAQNKTSEFLISSTETNTHHATERNLVGMIADISRIKINDKIIFYVQGTTKFYGIFKAVSEGFFDENDSNNYLIDKLNKGLSYRVKIAPDEVYANGITEHQLLDMLHQKKYPYQMCWSLIYRKLKGNRGCTMIFDYEYADILQKLRLANNEVSLTGDNFSYDSNRQLIVPVKIHHTYQGKVNSLDITNRMLFKANKKNAFEVHLQTYILQRFVKQPLHSIFFSLPDNDKIWIGNEVSCGVGMQRIDLLTIQEDTDTVFIKAIELKCDVAQAYIIQKQIPWYLQWLSDYVAPNYNKKVVIVPCIIAKKGKSKNTSVINAAMAYNPNIIGMQHNISIAPIEYIEFSISAKDITFSKIL